MASIESRNPRGTTRRYTVRWRTPEGDQRKKTFRLREDAERWAREVEIAKDRGGYIDPQSGRITFHDYAEQWRGAQLHHRDGTRGILNTYFPLHVYPHIGDLYLTSISRSTLQGWVNGLATQLAPSTLHTIFRWVATIFKAAMDDGLLSRTPCRKVNLPPEERKQVIPITPDELARLREAIPDRYRAAVTLGACVGLRQGECFGLTVDRVDFLRRTVRVDRQLVTPGGRTPILANTKTAASERTIPVAQIVLDDLAAHLSRFPTSSAVTETGRKVERLIFANEDGGPVRLSPFAGVFRRACRRAGLEGVTFHDLRHFYASMLISGGCSISVVQRRLGHKSASTTLDIYAHLLPDDDEKTRAAVDAMFPSVGTGAGIVPVARTDSYG